MERDTISAVLVGQRIRKAREARGLPTDGLAEVLGVDEEEVAAWEKGDSIPPFACLTDLCGMFGCELDDLVK